MRSTILLLACVCLAQASGWQSGVCVEDGSSMWTAGDKLIVRESGEYTVYRIEPIGGWNDLTHDFSAPMRVKIGKFSSLEAAEGFDQ